LTDQLPFLELAAVIRNRPNAFETLAKHLFDTAAPASGH
jgi:hypothetical protein